MILGLQNVGFWSSGLKIVGQARAVFWCVYMLVVHLHKYMGTHEQCPTCVCVYTDITRDTVTASVIFNVCFIYIYESKLV